MDAGAIAARLAELRASGPLDGMRSILRHYEPADYYELQKPFALVPLAPQLCQRCMRRDA